MKVFNLLALLLVCHLSAAEPIVLQNGKGAYDGFEDSYLNKHMFFTKYGDSTVIKTRYEDCSDWGFDVKFYARVVLKFDLSSIPANTPIEKAELSFYTFGNFIGYQGRVLPNGPKTLHVITTPWEEAKVTWQYPPEFDEVAIATSNEDKIKVWEHFDVTDYVNDVLSGSIENYGLLVKQVPTFYARQVPSTGVQIYSSEHSVIEMRPKLTLYKEPVTNNIDVKMSGAFPKTGSYKIEILNIKGQTVDHFIVEDVNLLKTTLNRRCNSNFNVVLIKEKSGKLIHRFLHYNM